MATATVVRPPTPEPTITLEMTLEEARVLRNNLGTLEHRVRRETAQYRVYTALSGALAQV